MKTVGSQLAALITKQPTLKREVLPFVKYLALLTATVLLFAWLFQVVMTHEGRSYSWLTGIYWTLTVMSTLGFGDITFHSDVGRLFSIVVLLTGVVMLLLVMPVLFIKAVYTPWLDQRNRARIRSLRTVPDDVSGHVLIAVNDPIAMTLVNRLKVAGIKAFIIEPDPETAVRMRDAGIPVICGEVDAGKTYTAAGIDRAALVFANSNDAENSNIVLTVRERSEDIPIVAVAESVDSIDILELSGATHVLPLRRQLGEQLASRVSSGEVRANIIGRLHSMVLAEFPVKDTPMQNKTIGALDLRDEVGVAIIGFWQGGRLHHPSPSAVLTPSSTPIVIGTQQQVDELNELLVIYNASPHPVLVLGGGRVGRAAARELKVRGVRVNLVERDALLEHENSEVADRVIVGDAADRKVLTDAGVESAPTILLTTHDDATNVYLTVYCRRLNPDARILTRVTYERNVEAIKRAGADFVLSYASLGVHSVLALVQGRDRVVLGEGADLFQIAVPRSLIGVSMADARIPERTGLYIIALEHNKQVEQMPADDYVMQEGWNMFALGTPLDRERFRAVYR